MKIYAFNLGVRCDRLPPKLLLIMKLVIIIMTFCLTQVSAAGFAQKINFTKKGATLKETFSQIRKQTGYLIFYSNGNINENDKLDADFKNLDVLQVLDKIATDKSLDYSIDKNNIIIRSKIPNVLDRLLEQFSDIDIQSRVVGENGTALAGATITVKGKKRTTTTNENGYFILNSVDERATIVVSYLGYTTLELNASNINETILMQMSSSKLDEVKVTTAYGIERNKKELGYSVAKVSGDELTKANSGTILSGLVGKVSGLNITAQSSEMSPNMRILLRGIRSFGQSSNNQPLFVFNGAPLSFGSDGDAGQRSVEFINNLNPADIEEVTVLKGANGTAMYGPEGVNGVILINTKKVKQGDLNINARVNTSYQRMDFRQRSDQHTFGVGDDFDFLNGKAVSNWGPAYNGSLLAIGYPDQNGQYQKVPYSYLNDKYDFFNVARTVRTNVSIAQGDQNSSMYLGLGHNGQTGMLPGDKQDQTTLFFNSVRKIGRSADFQFNINYARTTSDRGADVTGQVLTLPSFIPLLSYQDYKNSYWGGINNYWSGVSPYTSLDIARQKGTDNVFTGSLTANVKILSWLTLKDQISMNYLGKNQKKNIEPLNYAEYARADPFKRYDGLPQTEDYLVSAYGVNNDLLLSALHKTGDFVLRGNLGTTVRDNFEKQLKNKSILSIPIYSQIFVRSDYGIGSEELTRQTRSISALGNVSVGYKDKLFLELTGRNEWDSKRAKVARGEDVYFGLNSSIVLKELVPYLKKQEWISSLRLRLSATRTANMNIEPNQSERILKLVFPYPITDPNTAKTVLGYTLVKNPNPLIKPERVFSQEYGTEMGFFDNRINFDAVYYRQINNGVIMAVGVPAWSGYPDLDNAGSLRNTGWEFDLGLNPLVDIGSDISISLTGRFSINNNKVLKVSDIYNGTFITRDPGGKTYYAREGYSAFEFPVLDFLRDPEGRVIVDKSSGMPSVDYQHPKIMGRTLPVYQGGLTLNFTYKNFTLSSQADYSAGNDHAFDPSLISNGISKLTLLNNRQPFIFPNSVIQDLTGHYVENTTIATANAGKELFSKFADATIHSIASASYWKIREIALQYQMSLKSKWVKKLAASIYARDLFSFYPSSNIYGDPVASSGPGLKSQIQGLGERSQAQTNNISGGSSDNNVAPGTIIYGFTFGISF
ncbi:SusC/RagA family TonB-linked outer membrane protein [Pedobacter jamesrossensis]|uniref:SusC/RagA family TonB-linked outer membrane protein n=1 Tax=Pedobacter jamesrossensis TaxID=1908238 RepID=A0ABV8NMJ7_9SPHI